MRLRPVANPARIPHAAARRRARSPKELHAPCHPPANAPLASVYDMSAGNVGRSERVSTNVHLRHLDVYGPRAGPRSGRLRAERRALEIAYGE